MTKEEKILGGYEKEDFIEKALNLLDKYHESDSELTPLYYDLLNDLKEISPEEYSLFKMKYH